MKKLLSVFAAAAVLFGFASCSGDLHDDSIKPLYIEGAMATTRTAITMIDDTTQEYEFKYESSMSNEWGSPAAGVAFKFIKSAAAWTDDFGGKQDEPVYLNINDDFVTLEARSGSNSNPGNVVIDNLTPGETYRLILDYDAANKIVKVKVTGVAIDFPELKLIDEGGKEYPLTRSGSTYSYVWTSTEAGSKSFYATNGYLYYGADGVIDTEIPDSANLITVDYEADKEYIVKILTNFAESADVTIETGINNILNGFDGVFALFSDENSWAGGSTSVKLDIKDTNIVYFEYANDTNNPYAFLAVKKGNSWDVRYEADGTTTKVYELGTKIPTATKELKNEERGVIKILPYHKYGVTVTIDGENVFFTAEDKGEIAKEIPNLKDWGFKGNYFSSSWTEPSEGWAKFIETGTENEFSVEFVTTTKNVEFGFLDTTGEWAAGGGFVIDALDKSFEGSVKSGGNSKINGLTIDATYILTITVKDSDGNATAKVSLKA